MQRLSVVPLLLVHSAAVFPEVLVPLHVQLDQVADFDRVDLSRATVADLRGSDDTTGGRRVSATHPKLALALANCNVNLVL